jgi:hypothetical protein
MNNKRALPLDYQKYLKRKVGQLKKAWKKESVKTLKIRDACLCLARRSFNSGLPTRPFSGASPSKSDFAPRGGAIAK